jgi:hypothetical protein
MFEITTRWKRVMDKQKWAARGASFVAKAKATKLVWFPPEPAETGKETASTAKRATERSTKKTTGAAKKSTDGSKNVTARHAGRRH